MNRSNILLAILLVLSSFVSLTVQDVSVELVNSVPSNSNASVGNDDIKKWEEYKKSNYYLAPFEDDVYAIPDVQLEFIRTMTRNDMELFRTILREAIDKRNNFAPSVGLMWKYTGKMLGNFIRNRQTELRLVSRKEPKPAFFEMIAQTAETIINQSTLIKKEKGYTKATVDTDSLYKRVDAIFNYVQKIIETSPLGAYHKWNELILFKNEPNNPNHDISLIDEASDLTAQFRGMGYESCTFVARRIVNLLRVFARGVIPSVNDV